MKSALLNFELTSEVIAVSASSARNASRFQIIVESAFGVCRLAAIADSPEDGVDAFMCQMPGCAEGKIALFDADEQRVVASVKWRMGETEIGLRVPHRQNVFYDWHLALIALEVQAHRSMRADVELSA